MSYTLGVTHNFLPHYHEETSHHHQHHKHHNEDDENVKYEHILHQGHYDKGLYDFIICLIHDIEHPSKDCYFDSYIAIKTNKSLKKIDKLKLLATLINVNQSHYLVSPPSKYGFVASNIYFSPHTKTPPLRAPPSFSC